MNFTTNQVRQIIVLPSGKSLTKKFDAENASDATEVFFLYPGADGTTLQRSDIIPKDNIMSINTTTTSKMNLNHKTVKVSLRTDITGFDIIPGQEYTLRILLRQAHSLDEGDRAVVSASYKAKSGDTAATIYTALAKQLNANIAKEPAVPFRVTSDATGVTIEEVVRPWSLGNGPVRVTPIDVYTTPVLYNSVEYPWFDKESGEGYTETISEVANTGSKALADLEYFAMGERGDQYRMWSWPNVIPTTYLVDPSKEYTIVTIHYYWDKIDNAHRSERDLQLVFETSTDADAVASVSAIFA